MSRSINEDIKRIESKWDKETLDGITSLSKPLFIPFKILYFLYCPLVVMLGYNWIIPHISNLQPITYIQAFLLDLLISFIVKTKVDESDLDYDEGSFVRKIAMLIMRFFFNTFILLIMFILKFFV